MTGVVESLGGVRAKGVALLAVVFVVGALAGAAADRWWMAREAPRDAFPAGPLVREGRLPPAFERLELSPEQRRRIESILSDWRPRVDSLVGATVPPLRAVAESVRRDVEAVLTPEQRERLGELLPRAPIVRDARPGEGPVRPARDRRPGESGFVPPAERPGFSPPLRRVPRDTAPL